MEGPNKAAPRTPATWAMLIDSKSVRALSPITIAHGLTRVPCARVQVEGAVGASAASGAGPCPGLPAPLHQLQVLPRREDRLLHPARQERAVGTSAPSATCVYPVLAHARNLSEAQGVSVGYSLGPCDNTKLDFSFFASAGCSSQAAHAETAVVAAGSARQRAAGVGRQHGQPQRGQLRVRCVTQIGH